jgi:hypothetical protein
MTVNVSKPAINVREKLAELDKPTGIAGEAMLRAETPQEQFQLINAGRKNLLYNGNMRIAQRGVSHSGIGGDGYYSLDRWAYEEGNATPEFNITQENDAPDGFSKSLKFDVAVADTSIAGNTYIQVTQILEGVDLQSLAKGSSAAQPLTLSFWVKSNVTGTYAALLWDAPNARQNSASYTVDQSGVWEYKTITFVGDTTGSIDDDNTEGLSLKFILGIGIDYTGGVEGPTSHSTTHNYAANHAVNVAASTSNYWQITGVQLELGKVATPFEHRSYGEELALCQRYYQVLIDNANGQRAVAAGRANSTSTIEFQLPLSVGMRDITSLPQSNMGTIYLYSGGARVNTSGGTVSLNDDYLPGSSYVYLRTTGASVSDDRAYTIGGFLANAHLAVDGEL